MRSFNLFSLIANYKVDKDQFHRFLDIYDIELRPYEIEDIKLLLEKFLRVNDNPLLIKSLEGFFVSYKIPQIQKEFDLLKLGSNFHLNIELKSENTGKKIKEQLVKNKYYLGVLGEKTYYYTFVSSENKLYQLEDDVLKEVSNREFIVILQAQKSQQINDLDALFDPTNYLVSPFNSTENFLENSYFLTDHQQCIKNKIIEEISGSDPKIFSIEGRAGTGKTLLTYDIAKELNTKTASVLVVHCGSLNEGHYLLISQGWEIISIREIDSYFSRVKDYLIVIVDESQRIYFDQLEKLIESLQTYSVNAIFSYDRMQYLGTRDKNNNFLDTINAVVSREKRFTLNDKIRSNKEIAMFIKYFFYPKQPIKYCHNIVYKNIDLHRFLTITEALGFIKYLSQADWTFINYTSSRYDKCTFDPICLPTDFVEGNAHDILGQEFDNVAVLIDRHFIYKNNEIEYNGKEYYLASKMLFQIMTRARKRLCLIFINNNDLYSRSLEILSSVKK